MIDKSRPFKHCGFLVLILIGVIIFVSSGCAPKTRFVLLPDPDGHVGRLAVSSEKGEQVLVSAYETTVVHGTESAPSKPVIMNEADVKELFKDALRSQPRRPLQFILYFISGTNELTDVSIEMISQVIGAIEGCQSTDISVVGHTDRVGSKTYNQELSLKRASLVATMLSSRGVDPDIIEITSHGEGNPLIETPDGVAEPRNRRVEITVR